MADDYEFRSQSAVGAGMNLFLLHQELAESYSGVGASAQWLVAIEFEACSLAKRVSRISIEFANRLTIS